MSGCGYVCPLCSGTGMDDEGQPCTYCDAEISKLGADCCADEPTPTPKKPEESSDA